MTNSTIAEKHCRNCGETKPVSEFSPARPGKYRQPCKSCRAAERRDAPREVKDQRNAYRRAYMQTPRGKKINRASNKRRRLDYSRRAQRFLKQRDTFFRKRYGITADDYDSMKNKQEGRCAACGEPPHEKDLSVDHCHTTRRVRGLLCGACNLALGLLKDCPERIEKLRLYVLSHPFLH